MKQIKKMVLVGVAVIIMFGSTMTSMAATETGTYPTRKGTILVTPDAYKGLIPTGHAAMVLSSTEVVESLSGGVGIHKNNWKTKKDKIYGITVVQTTYAQDISAANWCKRQVGKSYNWNYFNTSTREKFYCSQLVWAAFKDNYGVNLNTSAFGNAIHPMELVRSSNTNTIYTLKLRTLKCAYAP